MAFYKNDEHRKLAVFISKAYPQKIKNKLNNWFYYEG